MKKWYEAYTAVRQRVHRCYRPTFFRRRCADWRMFVVNHDFLVGWSSFWDVSGRISPISVKSPTRALVLCFGWLVVIARLPKRFDTEWR